MKVINHAKVIENVDKVYLWLDPISYINLNQNMKKVPTLGDNQLKTTIYILYSIRSKLFFLVFNNYDDNYLNDISLEKDDSILINLHYMDWIDYEDSIYSTVLSWEDLSDKK